MYGQQQRFIRGGGRGRGQGQPPQQPPPPGTPNYFLNNNYYTQPPNFNLTMVNPNFLPQNYNLPILNPNPNPPRLFNPNTQSSSSNDVIRIRNSNINNNKNNNNRGIIDKIDNAVVKTRRELLAAGENVSAMKVSQAALVSLEVDSWDSLGVMMQNVPSLYRLMLIEGKINAFINCFVGVWKITTLSDLETAICKNEGVQKFEELELGPLIRHPLVNHYFCVSSDSSGVFKISGQEILNCLIEFMDTHKGKEVKADELLDFIAEKHSVDSKEKLHVRIQSLGLHIALIRQARPLENATIKKCLLSSSKPKRKRPLFTSQKKQLDENFSVITERIKSFSSGHAQHIRFHSSSSEEDDNDMESDDNEDETCLTSQNKNSSQSLKSSDRVSRCPYPSAAEEKTRLGISSEKEESPSFNRTNCNDGVNRTNKKRKSESPSSARNKISKRDGAGKGSAGKNIRSKVSDEDIADMSINKDSMITFITLWKEACKTKNVSEVCVFVFLFVSNPLI